MLRRHIHLMMLMQPADVTTDAIKFRKLDRTLHENEIRPNFDKEWLQYSNEQFTGQHAGTGAHSFTYF